MTAALIPAVQFDAPLVNPTQQGLYPVTSWTDEAGPSRFLGEGVVVRTHNYGGGQAFGVWDATWCAQPADLKDGVREADLDAFAPMVVWAYDQCDLTAASQREVRERAAQNLRLMEQAAVEKQFGIRVMADLGAAVAATDLVDAIGQIELAFAKTNTLGVIHADASWAAVAAQAQLVVRSGATLKTPLGHTWSFGGGYELGSTIVATSPTFGWRSEATVRDTIEQKYNQFAAIAERVLVVGYEAAIYAAAVGTP